MVTAYLSLYLLLIILIAAVVSYLVLKLKLPSPRLVITFIVLFIVSPLIGGYFYLAYFNSIPEVVVPDVAGLRQETAEQKLQELSLQAMVAGSVYEMKYPEGCVVSQRPEAGRTVKMGRMVNLIISSGKKKTTVPGLLGRPFSEADALLASAGLNAGEIKKEQNFNAEEGTILAQEPLPGEEVEMGQRIDLLVSTTMEVKAQEPTTKEEEKGGFKLW